MVEGAEFIIWEGAEWVELRLEEEGLAYRRRFVIVSKYKLQHLKENCYASLCFLTYKCCYHV